MEQNYQISQTNSSIVTHGQKDITDGTDYILAGAQGGGGLPHFNQPMDHSSFLNMMHAHNSMIVEQDQVKMGELANSTTGEVHEVPLSGKGDTNPMLKEDDGNGRSGDYSSEEEFGMKSNLDSNCNKDALSVEMVVSVNDDQQVEYGDKEITEPTIDANNGCGSGGQKGRLKPPLQGQMKDISISDITK